MSSHGFRVKVLLSAILLSSLSPSSLYAGDESSLEEVVIVSLPIHRSESNTALPVTILSNKELERNKQSTLGETIAFLPGVSSASFGPSVGQPILRGQSGPRIEVLNNSLSSADVASVSPDHAISVEPLLAESIEILRGPATLLYGGGAIGGVVNVIDKRIPTKAIDGIEGDIELRHASVNDETTAVVSLDAGVGKWLFHIDAKDSESNNLEIPDEAISLATSPAENTNGFIENTDARSETYGVGSSYLLDNGYVGFSYHTINDNYGIPVNEEQLDENESVRLDIKQERFEARTVLNFEDSFIETLRAFASYTDYEHAELEITPTEVEVGTEFFNDTSNLRVEILHAPRQLGSKNKLHGAFGLQWSDQDFESEGEEAYLPRADVENIGVFWVEDLHRGKTSFEFGLRVDADEVSLKENLLPDNSQSFTSTSFSASVLQPVSEAIQIGVAFSRSERSPLLEELYSNAGNDNDAVTLDNDLVAHVATGIVEVGDADLDSEKSNNIDLHLHYEAGEFYVGLTAYYNRFDDYIGLFDTGDVDIVEGVEIFAYRQSDATFKGVELEMKKSLGYSVRGNWEWQVFGDWIEAELENGVDVPRLPQATLGTALNYENNVLDINVRAIHAYGQTDETLTTNPDNYTKWDLSAEWRPAFAKIGDGGLAINFAIDNVTDEEIRTPTSFLRDIAPESGRSYDLGVRWSF